MNERIKTMMEQRAKLLHDAREILDKCDAEKRELTAEERSQYDALDADIDALQEKIDREVKLSDREEAAGKSANGGHNPVMSRALGDNKTGTDTREYRQSLIRYLAAGINDGVAQFDGFTGDEERSILGVSLSGVGATGGILAPTVLEKALLDFNRDYNIMRRIATVRSSASDIDIPYTATHTTAYHIAEGDDFTKSTPTWAKVNMKAYKAAALTVVTHEAMEDMFIDMESWVRDDFGMAFADLEENDFVNGTGTNQPTGFTTQAATGVTTASASAITGDELLDLVFSIDRKYRERGVFVMSDTAMKVVRKLKLGTGEYMWQPGIQGGQPDRLLGYPIYNCAKMAAVAAGAKPVAFGDFKFYRILDRTGLYFQRLNELYATSGQVGFMAYRRYDGKLLDTSAVKMLAMHA